MQYLIGTISASCKGINFSLQWCAINCSSWSIAKSWISIQNIGESFLQMAYRNDERKSYSFDISSFSNHRTLHVVYSTLFCQLFWGILGFCQLLLLGYPIRCIINTHFSSYLQRLLFVVIELVGVFISYVSSRCASVFQILLNWLNMHVLYL